MSVIGTELQDDAAGAENLIELVRVRAPIYDKRNRDHADRDKILKLWKEICGIMVPNYNDLPNREKTQKVKDMKSKWRNIQKCFRRELVKQRSTKSGQGYYKRKKYIYFNHLLFLLPTMEDQATVSSCNPLGEELEIDFVKVEESREKDRTTVSVDNPLDENLEIVVKVEELQEAYQEIDVSQDGNVVNLNESGPSTKHKSKRNASSTYEENLLTLLKEKKHDTIDEDESFLLSLLPTFQKLSSLTKIKLKMEFLAAVIRHSESEMETNQTVPRYHPYCPPQKSFHPMYPASIVHSFPKSSIVNRPSTVKNYPYPLTSTFLTSENNPDAPSTVSNYPNPGISCRPV